MSACGGGQTPVPAPEEQEPPTRAGFSLLLRENEITIPAGARDVVIAESITLPAPAAVLGLYPHAHYLGRDSGEFPGVDPRVIAWPTYVHEIHLPSVVQHARVKTTPGRDRNR